MLMHTLMRLKRRIVVHWPVQASVYAHMQAGRVVLPVLAFGCCRVSMDVSGYFTCI